MMRCFHCMREIEANVSVCPHCRQPQRREKKNLLDLDPGTPLSADRYMVGYAIGSGGFGITYIAWDQLLGGRRAIKEFFPKSICTRLESTKEIVVTEQSNKQTFAYLMARFKDEARRLERLRNVPNIVQIVDYFEANNTAYLVMDYLDGCNLNEYLKQRNGRMSQSDAIDAIKYVLVALRHMHMQGILHRDVSMDNIYRTRDEQILLIDFGAARDEYVQRTRTLTHFEKSGYTAPEQQKDMKQGPYTDLYALGVCLYKLISGQKPEFYPDGQLKWSKERMKAFSASLQKALTKALQPDPANRFQTAEEFYRALVAKGSGKRKPVIWIAGAAVILVGGLLIAVVRPPAQVAPTARPTATRVAIQTTAVEPTREIIITPEPATPEPVTPKPATPVPVTPEPATPVPATPESVTPEPATPEPEATATPVSTPTQTAEATATPVPSAIDFSKWPDSITLFITDDTKSIPLSYSGASEPDIRLSNHPEEYIAECGQSNGMMVFIPSSIGEATYVFTDGISEKSLRIQVLGVMEGFETSSVALGEGESKVLPWVSIGPISLTLEDIIYDSNTLAIEVQDAGLKVTALQPGEGEVFVYDSYAKREGHFFKFDYKISAGLGSLPDTLTIHGTAPYSLALPAGSEVIEPVYVEFLSGVWTADYVRDDGAVVFTPINAGTGAYLLQNVVSEKLITVTVYDELKALSGQSFEMSVNTETKIAWSTAFGTSIPASVTVDPAAEFTVETVDNGVLVTPLRSNIQGTLTVSHGGKELSAVLNVGLERAAFDLSALPDTIMLYPGQQYQAALNYDGSDEGALIYLDATSDNAAVQVEADSAALTITPKSPGAAKCVVSDGHREKTIAVTVVDQMLGVTPQSLDCVVGQEYRITWDTYYQTALNPHYVFDDADAFSAEVSGNAITFTPLAADGVTGYHTLSISDGHNDFAVALNVYNQIVSVKAGDAVLEARNENNVITREVSLSADKLTGDGLILSVYTATGDTQGISIQADGLQWAWLDDNHLKLTGLRPGSATVQMMNGQRTENLNVTLTDALAAAPAIDDTVFIGQPVQYAYESRLGSALSLDVHVGNEGILEARAENGIITLTPAGVGTTTLTIGDGTNSYPYTINVKATIRELDAAGITQLVGESAKIGWKSSGTIDPADITLLYNNNLLKVTVSPDGLTVQALAPGEGSITISDARGYQYQYALSYQVFNQIVDVRSDSLAWSAEAADTGTIRNASGTASALTNGALVLSVRTLTNDVQGIGVQADGTQWSWLANGDLKLSGLEPGLTTILLTCGNATETINIRITDELAGKPEIPQVLFIGQAVQCDVHSVLGSSLALNVSSDNNGVLEAQITGGAILLTPKNAGTAKVTVSDGINSYTYAVSVKAIIREMSTDTLFLPVDVSAELNWESNGTIDPGDIVLGYDSTLLDVSASSEGLTMRARAMGEGVITVSYSWDTNAVFRIPFYITFSADIQPLRIAASGNSIFVLNESDQMVYRYEKTTNNAYQLDRVFRYEADSGNGYIDLQNSGNILWATDDEGLLYVVADDINSKYTADNDPANNGASDILMYGFWIQKAILTDNAILLLLGGDLENATYAMDGKKVVDITVNNGNVLYWRTYAEDNKTPVNTNKTPSQKNLLSKVANIAMTGSTAAAVNENGELYLWGDMSQELLGAFGWKNALDYARKLEVKVKEGNRIKTLTLDPQMLAIDERNVLVLADDDTLLMAGSNDAGRLGIGNTDVQTNFVRPMLTEEQPLYGVRKATCSGDYIYALTRDNELYTWGNGLMRPVLVTGNIIDFTIAEDGLCIAVTADGNAYQVNGQSLQTLQLNE